MSHYRELREGKKREPNTNPLTLAPLVAEYFLKIKLSTHTLNLEEDDSITPNLIAQTNTPISWKNIKGINVVHIVLLLGAEVNNNKCRVSIINTEFTRGRDYTYIDRVCVFWSVPIWELMRQQRSFKCCWVARAGGTTDQGIYNYRNPLTWRLCTRNLNYSFWEEQCTHNVHRWWIFVMTVEYTELKNQLLNKFLVYRFLDYRPAIDRYRQLQ